MENEKIKTHILGLMSEELDQWFKIKDQITDGMEYEEKIIGIAQRIGKILISEGAGAVPKNRNKKNSKRVLAK